MQQTRKYAMTDEHQLLCERATNYLYEAGFHAMPDEQPGRVAMRRDAVGASLAIRYEPRQNLVRLGVHFAQDKPQRGVFCNGRGDLRIFVDPPALFSLLCWLTSSHDELLPDDVDLWLGQIVALCPKTYAVLRMHGGREILALVASVDPLTTLQ
jgi:hypothetical protein